MTLEDLLYNRLTSDEPLSAKLTTYGDKPAVFYQTAPDDTATGWDQRNQYPRIDYIIDYIKNPERKTSGVLTMNILCSSEGTTPEEIEPIARNLLCGVFFVPDKTPYCVAWNRSDVFDVKTEDGLIIGITVTFDVYAFPQQETTDPDPVLAINHFIAQTFPEMTVIGHTRNVGQSFAPTSENPAVYWRVESLNTQRETNTVVWLDGVLRGHVFAYGEETSWLRCIADPLALNGEVTMLDDSPMFIRKLTIDNTSDMLSMGQIKLDVRFGLLRRFSSQYPMVKPYFTFKQEAKFNV